MVLRKAQKEFIIGVIEYNFDLPETERELRVEIQKILHSISQHAEGEYEGFSRVFHNPVLITRLDTIGSSPTIGEVRESMVEYVGKLIASVASRLGKSSQDLGWSQGEIVKELRDRRDYNINFTRHKFDLMEKELSLHDVTPILSNAQVAAIQMGIPDDLVQWPWGFEAYEIFDYEKVTDIRTFMERDGLTVHEAMGLLLEGVSVDEDMSEVEVSEHVSILPERFRECSIGMLMERKGLTLAEACDQVASLTSAQMRGITLGLSYEQVNKRSFDHVTAGIIESSVSDKNISVYDAYHEIENLTIVQLEGIVMGFNREQVEVPYFGIRALKAIKALIASELSPATAYAQVEELALSQMKGVLNFLTPDQVLVPNFSYETARGIRFLTENANMTVTDAYNQLVGLKSDQIMGVLTGLSRDQVMVSHFSFGTLWGIHTLMQERHLSMNDAYKEIAGLTMVEIEGVIEGLSRTQVAAPNFSHETVAAMKTLMERTPDMSLAKAYAQVQGLSLGQINGILGGISRNELEGWTMAEVEGVLSGLEYHQVAGLKMCQVKGIQKGLSREQVMKSNFGYYTLRCMRLIKERDGLSWGEAYVQLEGLSPHQMDMVLAGLNHNQAQNINWYQAGGVQVFQLSYEQVTDVNFSYLAFCAIQTLISRDRLSAADAYARLQGLKDAQIKGIIAGLSYEQVSISNFDDDAICALSRDGMSLVDAHDRMKDSGSGGFGFTREQVLQMLKSFSPYQLTGLILGLSPKQVMVPHFSQHTVCGIRTLMADGNLSLLDAYAQVKELDMVQVRGVLAGLRLEQLQSGLQVAQLELIKLRSRLMPSGQAEVSHSNELPINSVSGSLGIERAEIADQACCSIS